MKYIVIFSFVMATLLCSCRNNKTDITPSTRTERQDSSETLQERPDVADSTNAPKGKITAEMAYEGVNNYCHREYDWSVAEDNPSMMYVSMGEETDSAFQVVFRSYTGSFMYFYVDKTSGSTRMVESVPNLGVESEAGTILLFDYLEKKE